MGQPKYTREFKEQAVQLSYTCDKNVARLAADLGIATNMLHPSVVGTGSVSIATDK